MNATTAALTAVVSRIPHSVRTLFGQPQHEAQQHPEPEPFATQFLTVPQVARLMGRSESATYRAVRNGTIPSTRISSRHIGCPTQEVFRLLDANPDGLAVKKRGTV